MASCCALALSCEADSEESQPSSDIDSGLDASAIISSLSDQDFAVLCDAYNEFVLRPAGRESLCHDRALTAAHVSSSTDAELQQSCQQAYQSCLEEPDDSLCPPNKDNCNATVGEWEFCYSEVQRLYEAAIAQHPKCSEVTLNDFPRQYPPVTRTPSCQTVSESCPYFPN